MILQSGNNENGPSGLGDVTLDINSGQLGGLSLGNGVDVINIKENGTSSHTYDLRTGGGDDVLNIDTDMHYA